MLVALSDGILDKQSDEFSNKMNAVELENGRVYEMPFIHNIEIDEKGDELNLNFKLGPNKVAELSELIDKFYVIADNKGANAESLNYSMQIHLTSQVPFYCNPRRLSYHEQGVVRDMISELELNGVIRPSRSPYASAIG